MFVAPGIPRLDPLPQDREVLLVCHSPFSPAVGCSLDAIVVQIGLPCFTDHPTIAASAKIARAIDATLVVSKTEGYRWRSRQEPAEGLHPAPFGMSLSAASRPASAQPGDFANGVRRFLIQTAASCPVMGSATACPSLATLKPQVRRGRCGQSTSYGIEESGQAQGRGTQLRRCIRAGDDAAAQRRSAGPGERLL
jgi:hypothetical protein